MSTHSPLKRPLVAVVLAITALLSGCASLLEEDTQEVNVRFMCAEKHLVATCDLKNDKGRWRLSTPGKATVINDTSQLEISCKMLGNLLFGGVVGAAVDVYNNSGMKYPENIDISNPNCK
jgi:hypothetical protein